MNPARAGAASIAELLLVFWLYGFVLLALAGLARGQSRLAAAQESAARRLELLRTAGVVLGAELRYLAPADLRDGAPDSLRLRAIRGGGTICDAAGDVLYLRYRGVRRPEPEKDSVLLLLPGAEAAAPVEEVGGGGACGDLSVRVAPPAAGLPSAGLALVFETGTYLVGEGALRYRRGAGGRQPLTETILRGGALAWERDWLRLDLAFRPYPPAQRAAEPQVLRIPLLNRLP